jgi:hypothetical protein
MEQEHVAEWIELQRQASAAIRARNGPHRSGTRRLLQIVIQPSFYSSVSWEIFAVAHPRSSDLSRFGIRTVWDQQSDFARLESPIARLRHRGKLEPSISAEQFAIPQEQGDQILDSFRSIRVPVAVSGPGGLDGTSYGLIVEAFPCSSELWWWEEGPPAWSELISLVHDAVRVFQSLVNSAG